jgi:hypothetical protein
MTGLPDWSVFFGYNQVNSVEPLQNRKTHLFPGRATWNKLERNTVYGSTLEALGLMVHGHFPTAVALFIAILRRNKRYEIVWWVLMQSQRNV